MISKLLFICILIINCLSNKALAEDELIIIQTVSVSKKSFAIRKGRVDGVFVGQKSLFSTRDYSLTAKVTKVNRDYSVWEIQDNQAQVPFKRNQVVTYTNSIDKVWTELSYMKFRQVAERKEAVELNRSLTKWMLRGNYAKAFSESVSEVESEQTASRVGTHLEGLYIYHLSPKYTTAFGIRYDSDVASKDATDADNPSIDIPSTRLFAIAEATYHFDYFQNSKNHVYLTVGVGFGQSATTVNEVTKAGSAYVLPNVRLGYETWPKDTSYRLFLEGVAESISATESFEGGDEQTTNIVNAKVALGIKF